VHLTSCFLDLRGTKLITLSASEKALGRFDIADNIRGMLANMLLAGASALIGTLWEVETNASKYFFIALYEQIRKGATRLEGHRGVR
jgi:CHAT domain-containing protein